MFIRWSNEQTKRTKSLLNKEIVFFKSFFKGGLMRLTKERRNELAWKLMVYEAREKGLSYLKPREFQKELINVSRELDVSREEIEQFSWELLLLLIEEVMSFPKTDFSR